MKTFAARTLAPLLLLACALAAGAQTPPGGGGPRKAGVIELARGVVPVEVTLTGQATAVEDASVRPLVDGVITAILYEPGREVAAGAPLFAIDSQTYQASVAAAEANLRSAEAAVGPARAALQRYEKLVGTGVTAEALENARMTLAQAEAAVAVAEASLQTARIALDRTTIRSPVAGVPDVAQVSVGDLVTSGQSTALTTVTALDPIHVDLSEASARMLDLRARIESGAVKPGDRMAVRLMLENGQVFDGTGTLSSVSSRVSTSTGTVRVRFRFDNPHRVIIPGMFVRASVTLGTAEGYLIPQMAARLQADGTIAIWLADAENRAQTLRVTPMGSTDTAWIVGQGLKDGDRLLVDSIDSLAAGTEIAPVAVTLSPEGVITDAAAPQAAPAPAAGN